MCPGAGIAFHRRMSIHPRRPSAALPPGGKPRSSIRVVLVALPVIAGCTGNIQRAARVPHPSVPLSSGQPVDGTVELAAGFSNVTDVVAPTVADHTQAVEVPSTQLRWELAFRAGQRTRLAAIYEYGLGSTSQRPDATQAPIGRGNVRGYGTSVEHAWETSRPGLLISGTVETMVWSLPYVEYTTYTGDGASGNVFITHGRANPITFGFGIAPSYRIGRLTVFGGAFARNHPTTERKEIGVDIPSHSGDVESGPFNLLLDAGLEVELDSWLSALVVVHQDVIASPLGYGPGVGIALIGRTGKRPDLRRGRSEVAGTR